MAATLVEVRAPAGLSLTLELFSHGSDTIANGGGDALVEATQRHGLYLATVDEPLAGWHTAHVKLDGALLALFDVHLADDADVHRCEDAPHRLHLAGVPLDASADIYPADVQFTIDDLHGRDEYTVGWFHNGQVLTAGITAATIEVLRRSDGATLIAADTPMLPLAETGVWKFDESTHRLAAGEAALVTVRATIHASERIWRRIVTRDTLA